MSDKSASYNCRLCWVSFKIQFGNLPKQSHSSSESIFKPSKQKECFGAVLSEIVRQVGFSLVQDSSRFFDRVSNPCGRKIRKFLKTEKKWFGVLKICIILFAYWKKYTCEKSLCMKEIQVPECFVNIRRNNLQEIQQKVSFLKRVMLFKTGKCLSWKENRFVDKPDEIKDVNLFRISSNWFSFFGLFFS